MIKALKSIPYLEIPEKKILIIINYQNSDFGYIRHLRWRSQMLS